MMSDNNRFIIAIIIHRNQNKTGFVKNTIGWNDFKLGIIPSNVKNNKIRPTNEPDEEFKNNFQINTQLTTTKNEILVKFKYFVIN